MRFYFTLVFSFLMVSVVLADHRHKGRQSRFLDRVEHPTDADPDVEYTTNWSGAVLDKDNETFTFVTGTFTAPVASGATGTAASAWVGIDGTCMGGILQAGVDFYVNADVTTYAAWYEWYPADSYYFSNFSISAHDRIRVNITAFSATSGMATLENLSNGQSLSSDEINSTYSLCGQHAEWIVEDFSNPDGTLVPLADFHNVTFTDAVASGTGTYTPDGASIVNIAQQNQVLTSVEIHGSSVTVNYL